MANHRFELQQFTVDMKDLAESFGLELARIGGRVASSLSEADDKMPIPIMPCAMAMSEFLFGILE